jgi:hypothetical protein
MINEYFDVSYFQSKIKLFIYQNLKNKKLEIYFQFKT